MASAFRRIASSFLELPIKWLYPPHAVCVACGALRVDVKALHICESCYEKLVPLKPPFCPRCGKSGWLFECPDCIAKKPDALDVRCAAYAYSDTARNLVRMLKYNSVVPAATALAEGMRDVMPPEPYDVIVAVPLYRVRLRQRGYNQAQVLGDALSTLTGIPVLDALTRCRSTKTQTRLSRFDRAQNVKGAFRACMPLDGLSVLLVDDVLTTGATAVSCAEALKEAGACRVVLLTAAQAQAGLDA